jgi:hypothetical protein
MFADARSFAVVGNAPTILEHENGAQIDAHDVVVRFNRATTEGLESKVGGRTDILVVNANNSRAMAPSPTETVRPKCIVCFVSPQGVPGIQAAAFADWVGELPVLLTFGPDLIDLPSGNHTRPMTSGTYFLLMILRMLTVEQLFVTGFTMFGIKGGASSKYYADDRAGVGAFHDLDVESQIFAALLSSYQGRLDLTDEVARLVYGASVNTDGTTTHAAVGSSARQATLVKRVASGLAWRVLGVGMRLRRYAESKSN